MLGTILLVVLILLFLGAIPVWPYSHDWGYMPMGIFATLLVLLILSFLLGIIPYRSFDVMTAPNTITPTPSTPIPSVNSPTSIPSVTTPTINPLTTPPTVDVNTGTTGTGTGTTNTTDTGTTDTTNSTPGTSGMGTTGTTSY